MELQMLLLLTFFCSHAQASLIVNPFYSIYPYKASLMNFAQPQCESDRDCVANGTDCFKGHCQCSWGFYNSVETDTYRCESYKCSFEVDCKWSKFCSAAKQLCACSLSSTFDRKAQTCQRSNQAYQLIRRSNFSLACFSYDHPELCSVRFGPGTRFCENAKSSFDCECKNLFWFNPKEKICIQISEITKQEAEDDKSFIMKHKDKLINVLIGGALCYCVYAVYSIWKQKCPYDLEDMIPRANWSDNMDFDEVLHEIGLLDAYRKHENLEAEYKSKVPDPPPNYEDALVNSDVVELKDPLVPPSYHSVITVQSDDDDDII